MGTPDIGDAPELFPSPSQWAAPASVGASQVDHPVVSIVLAGWTG